MQRHRTLVLLLAAGLTSSIALAQAAEAPAKPVLPAGVQPKPAPAPEAPASPVADKNLPSGKEVLERYVEKTGGRAAHEKVVARVVHGFMEMPARNIKAAYTLNQAAPNKYRMTIEIPGMGKFDEGSDGTTTWGMDLMQGPRVVEGEELEQKSRAMAFNADLEPQEHWKTIDTVGIEAVKGKPAYKVLLTPEKGAATTNFYDVESGLLVRTVAVQKMAMGDVPTDTEVSAYKEFEGVKVSTLQILMVLGMEQRMTMENVTHPEKVADEVFALPPEIKALVEKKAAAPAEKVEPKTAEPVKDAPKGG
ncbi:MAG: hypothetical protein ACKVS8_01855 [Phycisphaerales bacterium]